MGPALYSSHFFESNAGSWTRMMRVREAPQSSHFKSASCKPISCSHVFPCLFSFPVCRTDYLRLVGHKVGTHRALKGRMKIWHAVACPSGLL